MKKALILVLAFMSSCQQQDEEAVLHFDEVTHYHIQMENQDVYDLASQDTLPALKQFKIDILVKNTPESLSDTLIIENLVESGFSKNKISKEKLSQLQSIFSIENEQTKEVNECVNVYRDIFIFRTKNQITGLAKVCLECEMMYVLSSNYQRITQLSEYDMEELKKILIKSIVY